MLDNADVRLVWDHQVDPSRGEASASDRSRRDRRHRARRVDVGLRPVHLDERIRISADPTWDPEGVGTRWVRREFKAQRPWARCENLVLRQVERLEALDRREGLDDDARMELARLRIQAERASTRAMLADDPALRQARLGLFGTLRNMVLMTGGDIAEIAPDTPTS